MRPRQAQEINNFSGILEIDHEMFLPWYDSRPESFFPEHTPDLVSHSFVCTYKFKVIFPARIAHRAGRKKHPAKISSSAAVAFQKDPAYTLFRAPNRSVLIHCLDHPEKLSPGIISI